jgi:hypothetical protein
MTSLSTAVLGFAAHGAGVWAKVAISIPDNIANPQATRYLGMLTWLTVQTNIICFARYALVLAAHALDSTSVTALTVQLFPLCFGLGFMLTLLYYGLDHFNPVNVQKRKEFSVHVAPHVELAAHLSHGTQLAIAVLDACTFTASGHSQPAVVPIVGGYIIFYMLLTLANHAATSAWQYPVIGDAQRAAGWVGVLLFFGVIMSLMMGAAHLGVSLVAGLSGWQ